MTVVHLQGAEQVERAADSMRASAEKMKEAAKEMDYTLGNHQRFLSDWLERFQGTISDLGEMLSVDTPIPVCIVSRKDGEEEDDHTAKTIPAARDDGPTEFEGDAA